MRPVSPHDSSAKAIFTAALAIADPLDRGAYVERTCGAESWLKRRVESPFSAIQSEEMNPLDHVAELFCGTVAQDSAWTADGLFDETIPSEIGPYRLIRPLGEGGMGLVLLAEQTQPVKRTVALKLIKPGMDSRELMARFRAEQQALAMMDHPNIARVIEAGVASRGRPYFVMEYVEGKSITAFCEEHRLNIRARLHLFQQVCRAVQHAHQKGIIHRDLKPGNLLTALQDGAPVAKVIDFGIAKALGTSFSGDTFCTRGTQLLGTPIYMSPEQAAHGSQDIDTRSDVYSLGVILYELLTGTTPIDRELFSAAGVEEAHRMIRDLEPPRPSERVTVPLKSDVTGNGRDARATGIARDDLRGELDWIVMKALEKDRSRRYQSAGALADDVERFLNDEPVEACPPTRLYLLQKFVRRNRGALTTVTIVLAALLSGLAMATWQAVVATQARRVADQRFKREQEAHRVADRERDRASQMAEQFRRLLYAADLSQAHRAWQRNDSVRKRELLSRHVPAPGEQDLRGFEWHYLWQQTAMSPRVIAESHRPLYFCEYSPDGQLLAAAGGDDRIRLFDARTLEPVHEFESGQREVNGLAFSSTSRLLASAGDDGSVVLWNLPAGTRLRQFQAHRAAAFQVRFLDKDQSLISCGDEHDLRLWKVEDGSLLRSLQHHTDRVEAIATGGAGVLISASKSGHCCVWRIGSRPKMQTLAAVPGVPFNAVAVSPDNQSVALGQSSGVFSVRRLSDGLIQAVHSLPDSIHSVAWSPAAGSQTQDVAVGDRSGLMHLYHIGRGNASGEGPLPDMQLQTREWQAHQGRIFGVAFAPDGTQLVTAGEDGRLCVWSLNSQMTSRILQTNCDDVISLGGNRLLAAVDGKLMEHDVSRAEPVATLAPSSPNFYSLKYARNARRVFAIPVWSSSICQIPIDSAEFAIALPDILPAPEEQLARFDVTPDGDTLAAIYSDLNNELWLTIRGKDVRFRAPCRKNSLVRCSPDGHLVACSDERSVILRNTLTGETHGELVGHNTTIIDFAFSPDGNLYATASADRTVRIWDAKSCQELWSVTAHANSTNLVAFAPDSQTVATTGGDGVLRLWRWQDATMTFELPLVSWPVTHLMFSGDGLRIVVREKEGRNVRVYDAVPVAPL